MKVWKKPANSAGSTQVLSPDSSLLLAMGCVFDVLSKIQHKTQLINKIWPTDYTLQSKYQIVLR